VEMNKKSASNIKTQKIALRTYLEFLKNIV